MQEDYVGTKVEKDEVTQHRLYSMLDKTFLFNTLQSDNKEKIVDLLEKKNYKTGTNVITQGEEGN